MKETSVIDTVDGTLECVRLRWRTNDVDRSLSRRTDASEQGKLRVGEWFRMDSFQTLQRCLILVRANVATAPFS